MHSTCPERNSEPSELPIKLNAQSAYRSTLDSIAGMDAYDFILDNIDSVPHLEALILLWNSRPVGWTVEELSTRLYIPPDKVNHLIRDLLRIQIAREIPGPPTKYTYFQRSNEQDDLMQQVDTVYRRDLVRISTMIHNMASSPVREFARAFKLRKEPNNS